MKEGERKRERGRQRERERKRGINITHKLQREGDRERKEIFKAQTEEKTERQRHRIKRRALICHVREGKTLIMLFVLGRSDSVLAAQVSSFSMLTQRLSGV